MPDSALGTRRDSSGCRIPCPCAKFPLACATWAHLPEVHEGVDSGGVPVRKFDLDGIVSHRACRFGRHLRLKHRQNIAIDPLRLLARLSFPLIVACGAGTVVSQVRKIIPAGMPIRPCDLDALARRHVHLYARRLPSHVLGYRHCTIILAETTRRATLCKKGCTVWLHIRSVLLRSARRCRILVPLFGGVHEVPVRICQRYTLGSVGFARLSRQSGNSRLCV